MLFLSIIDLQYKAVQVTKGVILFGVESTLY